MVASLHMCTCSNKYNVTAAEVSQNLAYPSHAIHDVEAQKEMQEKLGQIP